MNISYVLYISLIVLENKKNPYVFTINLPLKYMLKWHSKESIMWKI